MVASVFFDRLFLFFFSFISTCFFFFFFFQAEDGIRDVAVTGVQTCALPICRAIVVAERNARLDFRDPHTFRLLRSLPVPCRGVDHMDFSADGRSALASCERSEERRVGKECRSRWALEQYKKKVDEVREVQSR